MADVAALRICANIDNGSRRLAENDLKPWRKGMWCISRVDGEYVARVEDVLDLYAEAPDPKRPVVCFDESPVHLIGEVRQPIPAEPGQLERYDCEYARYRNRFFADDNYSISFPRLHGPSSGRTHCRRHRMVRRSSRQSPVSPSKTEIHANGASHPPERQHDRPTRLLAQKVLQSGRTIRRPELRKIVPLGDTTIYEMEQRGEFPRRFYLTARCVVWDLAEVEVWIEQRRRASDASLIKRAPSPDVRLRKSRPVR
jgi:predicted DNA-binding transcriptional regulator AlpA